MKLGAFVIDIDNTLVHVPSGFSSDWFEYAEMVKDAELNEDIVEVIDVCNLQDISVLLVTYRSDSIRTHTEEYLRSKGIVYTDLIMRESGTRKDKVSFKLEKLKILEDTYNILQVFDDNKIVVDSLTDAGYDCTHVTKDIAGYCQID